MKARSGIRYLRMGGPARTRVPGETGSALFVNAVLHHFMGERRLPRHDQAKLVFPYGQDGLGIGNLEDLVTVPFQIVEGTLQLLEVDVAGNPTVLHREAFPGLSPGGTAARLALAGRKSGPKYTKAGVFL